MRGKQKGPNKSTTFRQIIKVICIFKPLNINKKIQKIYKVETLNRKTNKLVKKSDKMQIQKQHKGTKVANV